MAAAAGAVHAEALGGKESSPTTRTLRRTCDCGRHLTPGAHACPECRSRQSLAARGSASTEAGHPRLLVSRPSDPAEIEAERVAANVSAEEHGSAERRGGRSSLSLINRLTLHRACACQQRPDDDAESLQRCGYENGPEEAPAIVHEALQSPGSPLEASARRGMERRFGRDFSAVRVHTGSKASESAGAVRALAYTVGNDIVFGQDAYAPATPRGRQILAHELAHVVQDEAAPKQAPVRTLHRLLCDSLLTAREQGRVGGTAAHQAIFADFAVQAGTNTFITTIPNASFSAFRTEGCGDPPTAIAPQILGGRAGGGIPDLGYRAGSRVELAEIKAATFGCVHDAEQQVRNYQAKGNAPENREWRRQRGISRFDLMSPGTRYTPTSPLPVGNRQVSVGWCEPGVIVYKAAAEEDRELFLCSAVSDQRQVDQFLDRILGRAEAQVDQFIDRTIDPAISRAIQRMTIRDGLRLLYRHGRETLRTYLQEQLGTAGALLVEELPEEATVEVAARWLDEQVGAAVQEQLRTLATAVKNDLVRRVRERIKRELHNRLQQSLNELCAAAAVGVSITAAQLLRKLAEDLARIFGEVAVEVAREWAAEVAREVAITVVYALLIAIAVVLIILFLPEILAAIAAIGAAIGAAATALAGLVPELIGIILGLAPAAARASQFVPAVSR
jgi:Domain of unknown function (DUF4157)